MAKSKIVLTLLCVWFAIYSVTGQVAPARKDYIESYKAAAIEQMEVYGIPASIKMAQALLESDNGNSRLAREANNHFGIKCKREWTGETISHDDDAPGECFRKYASPMESFKDHSEFLDKSARYQDLFKLDPMDYKGWAYGLKKAGYATNPAYAEMLIKIIEDNQLYLLDQGGDIPSGLLATAEPTPAPEPVQVEIQAVGAASVKPIDIDNYNISIQTADGRHSVYHNNGSQFVIAAQGDTYASIARAFSVSPKNIYAFNDVAQGTELRAGEMVYIRRKSKRSENGKLIHSAKEGETMHAISQMYGIRLGNLISINRRPKNSEVREGQQIRLM